MTTSLASAALTPTATRKPLAEVALQTTVRLWFLTAVVGQWIFALYIAVYFGGTALKSGMPAWNKSLFVGYQPGDILGNLALATHLFMAAVLIFGGPLQLIPQIRA